ncbi:MAG: hypothetical protein ACKVOP_07420 [Sphingomonadaceae bacterium]
MAMALGVLATPPVAVAQPSQTAKPVLPAKAAPSGAAAERVAGGYVLVPISDLALVTKAAPNGGIAKRADWGASIAAVAGAVMWPLVTLFLVLTALRAPQIQVLFNFLNRRTSQIAILGVEIKLNDAAEATIDDLKTLVGKVPQSHEAWVHNTHLLEQFRNVIVELQAYLVAHHPGYPRALCDAVELKKLRFTLHVPDIVFSHSLRQLVDYRGYSRGGAGRLFSVRRGIIGLAWRAQTSQYQARDFNADELVKLWGMTRLEALDTSSEKSLLLAFVLKGRRNQPVGLLYVDGDVPEFFKAERIGTLGADQVFAEIDQRVANLATTSGLTASLWQLDKARVGVTQLDIYEIT